MKQVSKIFTTALVLSLGGISWLSAQEVLHADERINGKLVTKAFERQRVILQKSSAVIYTDGRSRIKSLYGMVMSPEGHVLTKASEISGKNTITMRIGSQLFEDVELIGVDEVWDVALLKVKSETPFVPADLVDEDSVSQGHWVVSNGSTTRSQRRVRVGIISAETREIKSSAKVVMGVQLGQEKEEQFLIKKVSEKTGAEKAGLKEGDILISADGIELKQRKDLLEAMKGKKPGDVLSVEVLRKSKKMSFEVELMAFGGKKPMSRNDQMSGGALSLSERRDGFPRVIHHDTPLTKVSVGGPLLDLNGKCIGMNIARASRVATFAIPARELRDLFERLLNE